MTQTLDTKTINELSYRKEVYKRRTQIDPENAVDNRTEVLSYGMRSGQTFNLAVIEFLLGEHERARTLLKQSFADLRTAYAANNSVDVFKLYLLFCQALLLSDEIFATETAEIIIKLGLQQDSNIQLHSDFYLALSSLWLEDRNISKHIPEITKSCNRKRTSRLYPQTGEAVQALADQDQDRFIVAMDSMLVDHHQQARAVRSYTYNQPAGFISEICTCLAIVALKYGWDIKPQLKDCQKVLKIPMLDPSNFPELPKDTKFELPVDYIPDFFLNPWREKLSTKQAES